MSANSPPLLLVDPAYHGNVGDNLIAYGELVLMERLGFANHTECHIIQSQGDTARLGSHWSRSIKIKTVL